jgi:8-oxo-dGTP diphosphatase
VRAVIGQDGVMAESEGSQGSAALAPTERYASIIDVHVILRRNGKILLLRRAGDTWASGRLCLPSGHLEEGEDILRAAVRETAEETGVVLAPEALRLVLSIHQRHPGTGHARIGFAFEPVGGWEGDPVNAEPHKHSELVWADPAALPPDTVDYTAAVIAAVERGDTFALNGW